MALGELRKVAATGPSAFGTAADDAAVGATAWANPNNAKDDNNTYATASITGGGQSHYLKLTNPSSLSIPAGAIIDGITIDIDRKSNLNVSTTENTRDAVVSLVKGGTVQGDNKADTGTNWPTTESRATYGNSGDLWGVGWTATDFGATFGVVLSVNTADLGVVGVVASVDFMQVTVEYTVIGTHKKMYGKSVMIG